MESTSPRPEDRTADSGTATPATASTDTLGFSHMTRDALEDALARATERIGSLEDETRRLRAPILDGSDPRLLDFWDKARRVAEHAGFCSEYDRIAVSLGGPARMLDWSGQVETEVTLRVTVPVGGTATPEEIEHHTMDWTVDEWALYDIVRQVVDGMSRYDIEHEPDESTLEVTETEPAQD